MTLKILLKLSKINAIRYFATQRTCLEVRIPVSGGYVSGKWWGPEDRRPILALHGWQDNCGTFDRLIPLLPPHVPVLAVDFPGHGFSSHLAPGMAYHEVIHLILIKQIKNCFGWNKVSLMGHSMGGIATYLYGSLYPNELDFAIFLDRLIPMLNNKAGNLEKNIEAFIRYDKLYQRTEEPPSSTFEEVIKKVHLGSKASIDIEVAKHILYRSISPSKQYPGRFYFNRDIRTKVESMNYHDPTEIVRVASKITFPLLVCRAENTLFFGRHPIVHEVLGVLKKCSKDFQFHEVPGTHHCHLNNPDILAELITEFLLKHDCEDRSRGGLKTNLKVDECIYPIYKYKQQILSDCL